MEGLPSRRAGISHHGVQIGRPSQIKTIKADATARGTPDLIAAMTADEMETMIGPKGRRMHAVLAQRQG
jgi:hypothetical protein